jgi:hypothetical protein
VVLHKLPDTVVSKSFIGLSIVLLRTGEPIEIDRGGKKLLIVPKEKQAKMNNLARRDVILGDPEDLVHLERPIHSPPFQRCGLDEPVQ